MKSFWRLLGASIVMLRRNRVLILSSLGLGLISIFVFGWLFGGSNTFRLQLGIASTDTSPGAAHVVDSLRHNAGLDVFTGSQDQELADLRAGHRDAVLVLPADFGASLAQGHVQMQVYYNQSNQTTLAVTRSAMQSIVADLNQRATGQVPPVTVVEQAVSVHKLTTIDFLTPGMIGMMIMWANLAVGTVLVGWRQQGIMKRLAATPLRPGMLIATQMIARLLLSLAQAVVLLVIAMVVFHVQMLGNWLALGIVLTAGTLSMQAIGFVIGSFAKNQDVAQAIMFLITFPMMFLGGSYFATDNAPAFLQPVVNALPLTHLNDALRQIMNNGASLVTVQTDVLVLFAWMVAGLLLATRAFRWA